LISSSSASPLVRCFLRFVRPFSFEQIPSLARVESRSIRTQLLGVDWFARGLFLSGSHATSLFDYDSGSLLALFFFFFSVSLLLDLPGLRAALLCAIRGSSPAGIAFRVHSSVAVVVVDIAPWVLALFASRTRLQRSPPFVLLEALAPDSHAPLFAASQVLSLPSIAPSRMHPPRRGVLWWTSRPAPVAISSSLEKACPACT
jgi:hypothetical protein